MARSRFDTSATLGRLAVGVVVGLGVGVATSYLQGVLPGSTNFLANSGAVWTIIAFMLALWAAGRASLGATAGVLVLLCEVLGYYAIASPLREIETSFAERTLWVGAALVIGPVAGWAAYFARCGRPAERAVAVGAACGLVAGEGAYAFDRLSHPVQGWLEIVIGVLALVASAAWSRQNWHSWAAAPPAFVATGALVYGAYVLW